MIYTRKPLITMFSIIEREMDNEVKSYSEIKLLNSYVVSSMHSPPLQSGNNALSSGLWMLYFLIKNIITLKRHQFFYNRSLSKKSWDCGLFYSEFLIKIFNKKCFFFFNKRVLQIQFRMYCVWIEYRNTQIVQLLCIYVFVWS